MDSILKEQLLALPKYDSQKLEELSKQHNLTIGTTKYYFYTCRKNKKISNRTKSVKPILTKSINLTTNAEIVIEGVKIMIPGNSVSINGTKIEW